MCHAQGKAHFDQGQVTDGVQTYPKFVLCTKTMLVVSALKHYNAYNIFKYTKHIELPTRYSAWQRSF